jgi:hypothetical protein
MPLEFLLVSEMELSFIRAVLAVIRDSIHIELLRNRKNDMDITMDVL